MSSAIMDNIPLRMINIMLQHKLKHNFYIRRGCNGIHKGLFYSLQYGPNVSKISIHSDNNPIDYITLCDCKLYYEKGSHADYYQNCDEE